MGQLFYRKSTYWGKLFCRLIILSLGSGYTFWARILYTNILNDNEFHAGREHIFFLPICVSSLLCSSPNSLGLAFKRCLIFLNEWMCDWMNEWLNYVRCTLPLSSIVFLLERRKNTLLLYPSPIFTAHVWRLKGNPGPLSRSTEKGNEMGLWGEASCKVSLPREWVIIIIFWEWTMNKMVLRWKETQDTEARSTWYVSLLKEISHLDFKILLYFPPLTPIWKYRMSLCKLISVSFPFPEGQPHNSFLLHHPSPSLLTHRSLYLIAFIKSGWAVILSRLFVVGKL